MYNNFTDTYQHFLSNLDVSSLSEEVWELKSYNGFKKDANFHILLYTN